MADIVTIQSIHPEAKQMTVVFNIEGTTYPKVLPFFTTQDAELLKKQLKTFAKELKTEFDDLKKAVEAADSGAVQPPTDAVNSLVGQDITVDDAPTDGGTPTDGGATTPPTDSGAGAETPVDGGTQTPAPGSAQTTEPTTPAPGSAPTDGAGTPNPAEGGTTPADGTGTPADGANVA